MARPFASANAWVILTDHLVDVNRKDYRAWYGLGQAYELLNMHEYALHYYQYATALRYVVLYCSVKYRTTYIA